MSERKDEERDDILGIVDRFVLSAGGAPSRATARATPAPPPASSAPKAPDLDALDALIAKMPGVDPAAPSAAVEAFKSPAPSGDLDALLSGMPEPESAAASQPALPAAPQVPAPRSYTQALTQGVDRGWKQVLSTVPHLRGIYAEATGDAEGQALEQSAARPVQDFKNIANLEDFSYWLTEKFGEQVPIIGSTIVAGGAGGLVANLAARGLMSSVGARALLTQIGAGTAGLTAAGGLETAGIGSEIREATGLYRPEVSIPAGAAAGMLELLTPLALTRSVMGGKELGKNLASSIAKGMALEASTEAGQESIALLARKYADPGFELFSVDSAWRLAESTAAGGLLGGGFAGVAHLAGGERRGTQRDVDPEQYADTSWKLRPVDWLRDRFTGSQVRERKRTVSQVLKVNPALDEIEAGVLLDTVGLDWALSGIRVGEQQREAGRFIEDSTKRYVHPLDDKRVLNATDLEEVASALPPAVNAAKGVKEVNQGKLIPAAISAEFRDLPSTAMDGRVYFLPGTSQSEKQQLSGRLAQLIDRSKDPELRPAAELEYFELLNQGLRIIPSYGRSFIYTDQVEGKDITKLPKSGRSEIDFVTGNKTAGNTTRLYSLNTLRNGKDNFGLDLNVFPPGTISGFDSNDKTLDWINRLQFPADFSTEEQTEIRQKLRISAIGLYSDELLAEIDHLFARGIYVQPDASATHVVVSKEYDLEKMKLPGLANLTGVNTNEANIRQFKPQIPSVFTAKSEISFMQSKTAREYPADWKVFLEAQVAELNALMLKNKLPVPAKVEFYFTDHLTESAGLYYPARRTIQVMSTAETLNAAWQTLLHEYGHHVTITMWNTMNTEQQQQVYQGYRRQLVGMTRDKAKKHLSLVFVDPDGEARPYDDVNYTYSFIEYLAEQFVRWAFAEKGVQSTAPAEYAKFARTYMELYQAVAGKKLPGSNTELQHMLKPEYNFALLMEHLKNEKLNSKPHRRIASQLEVSNTNPTAALIVEQLDATINELKHLFPRGWTVEVGDPGAGNIAVTLTGKKAVLLGIAAYEYGARNIVTHEAVHASRDLFTATEWNTLVKAVPADIRGAVERGWGSFYRQQVKDLGLDPEVQGDYVRRALEEEGVAVMMGMRAAGVSYPQPAVGLIDRFLQFLGRLAQALGARLGWTSKEAIINSFFRGEIAARDGRQWLDGVYGKWLEDLYNPQKTVPAERPKRVEKISDRLWVQVFYERNEVNKLQSVQYRFFTNVDWKTPLRTLADKSSKVEAGKGVGVMFLSHNPKGFEIDLIEVNKDVRRQGFASEMYKFAEKDLKQAMKPSGYLLDPGYRYWLARDPEQVKWHVRSEDGDWYSPNNIVRSLNLYNALKNRMPNAKDTIDFYKRLYAKVDPRAWSDPRLNEMFHVEAKGQLYALGQSLAAKEQLTEETWTGLESSGLGFDEAAALKLQESQEQNARLLKVPVELSSPAQLELKPMRNLLNSNQLTSQQKKLLRGLTAEADRISWFSKKWWGIHQLSWANPHIEQLRKYMVQIESWVAKAESWVFRADQTARDWERNLNPEQRAALAELLFYMTEMRYLSPAEVANGVVRLPTQAEVVRAFQLHKLTPVAQQMYIRIESDFAAFLAEIERVSMLAIQREFAGQRVNGQPSVAETTALNELAAEMQAMRQKPYFPMTRFGEWTLTVRDPVNRQVRAFYTFESQAERNAYITTAAKQWIGDDLQIGRLSEEMMEFTGIPGPLLKRIKASLPGLTAAQREWLDQLSNQLAPERSFRKRWMQRRETPGYSLDAFRVYSNYFQTGAKYLARMEFKDQAQDTINQLQTEAKQLYADSGKRMQIADFMQQHLNYMVEGGRDWGKLKAFIAMWHLGYSPIAAAMNLTQIPLVTMPYLSALFGNVATFRALSGMPSALKQSFNGVWYQAPWPGYSKGRQELIERGKIEAGQAPELAAYASANNLYKTAVGSTVARGFRGLAQHSMWMFGKAERFNRELTYAMTFKLAMENPKAKALIEIGMTRLDEIAHLTGKLGVSFDEAVAIIAASDAIDRTHGIYAPWARPVFLRNPLAATIGAFFTYIQMMLFALRHNPGNIKHLFMLMAIAGMMGLPGAEDLDKLIEAVARRIFGKDFSPKNEARRFMNQILEGTPYKPVGADILLHGISRYGFGVGLLPEGWGAPRFDVSGNLSMGKIVPGLGESFKAWGTYQDWSKVMATSTQEAAGAGFGVMFNLLQFLAASADPGSMEWKKWEKVMPRTVKAMSKGIRYGVTGEETFKSGAQMHKFDIRDPDDMATIVAQFLGATPRALNAKWQANAEIQETVMFYRAQKRVLYEQLSKAVRDQDTATRDEVLKAIVTFNGELRKRGPEFTALGIDPRKLQSSLRNRGRTEALQELDLSGTRSEYPATRALQGEYPEVRWRKER